MAECVLPKDETGVRFSSPAPKTIETNGKLHKVIINNKNEK